MQYKDSLFSMAYLAPVSYFQEMLKSRICYLEQFENYEKQSYRNRCRIITSNSVMDLSIPVEKSNNTLIRDIKISMHDNWQQKHWRAIMAAYNSSPFFEYYADDLIPFYEKKWDFLWDYNLEIHSKIIELLDIDSLMQLTTEYQNIPDEVNDFRQLIHPKKESTNNFEPYYQVFQSKHGFISDVSIIDLLFNMGPESQLILGIS